MNDHLGFPVIEAGSTIGPPLRDLAKSILEVQDLSFSADGLETLLQNAEIISASALALNLVFGRMKDHANGDAARLVVALTAAE